MIDIQDVIRIHEILIDNFGGSKGIRDRGLLESAISRSLTNAKCHAGSVDHLCCSCLKHKQS